MSKKKMSKKKKKKKKKEKKPKRIDLNLIGTLSIQHVYPDIPGFPQRKMGGDK